jgi:hypothetical protein
VIGDIQLSLQLQEAARIALIANDTPVPITERMRRMTRVLRLNLERVESDARRVEDRRVGWVACRAARGAVGVSRKRNGELRPLERDPGGTPAANVTVARPKAPAMGPPWPPRSGGRIWFSRRYSGDSPFSREVLRDFRDSRCFQWNQEK